MSKLADTLRIALLIALLLPIVAMAEACQDEYVAAKGGLIGAAPFGTSVDPDRQSPVTLASIDHAALHPRSLPDATGPERLQRPAAGVLLIARREMADPRFRESVILLVSYDEEGALGLIVNKPTSIPLSKALTIESPTEHTLYFGGPVQIGNLFFLARADTQPHSTLPVGGDLYFGANRTAIEQLLTEGRDADSLRLYLGYSGWSAGQLEGELERGDWLLTRSSNAAIFWPHPDQLWQQLIKRLQPEGQGGRCV